MQTDRTQTSNISGSYYSITHLNVPEGGHVCAHQSKSEYIIELTIDTGITDKLLLYPFILSSDDAMISLVWFQSDLLLRLDSFRLHFLNFLCKHDLRVRSRIDAICFDRDYNTAIKFEEHVGIQSDNTCLIRLTLAIFPPKLIIT